MTDQADMEALTRARELGILDRVLTDAENAIYDAGMAAAYARAAEVAHTTSLIDSGFGDRRDGMQSARDQIAFAILALGEAKG